MSAPWLVVIHPWVDGIRSVGAEAAKYVAQRAATGNRSSNSTGGAGACAGGHAVRIHDVSLAGYHGNGLFEDASKANSFHVDYKCSMQLKARAEVNVLKSVETKSGVKKVKVVSSTLTIKPLFQKSQTGDVDVISRDAGCNRSMDIYKQSHADLKRFALVD